VISDQWKNFKKGRKNMSEKEKFCRFEDGGLVHPCGHESDVASACDGAVDAYRCPACGQGWKVVTDRDDRGWPVRRVVVEAQRELALG
jgi:hypothetical protein